MEKTSTPSSPNGEPKCETESVQVSLPFDEPLDRVFQKHTLRHTITEKSDATLVSKDTERVLSPKFLSSSAVLALDESARSDRRPFPLRVWKSPVTKIVIVASMVVIPMVVFSIAILALIFTHQMEKVTCPYEDLCPMLNQTDNNYYYVDYSATQLVFIASWSSSISLSLISMLMFLFSYLTARRILLKSHERDSSDLPTPFQLALLIKILNGELLALYDFFMYKFQSWCVPARRRKVARPDSATVLYMAVSMLLVGVVASLFIQAADTWLHVATSTVEIVTVRADLTSPMNQFGRGLGSWCTDKPIVNNGCNPNFLGCGINCIKEFGSTGVTQSNQSATHSILTQRSSLHDVLNYTDSNSLTYAVLGPANVPSAVDWTTTSFAVTSQCRPIMSSDCDVIPESLDDTEGAGRTQFNCRRDPSLITGNITHATAQIHYDDAHNYFNDTAAFEGWIEGKAAPGFNQAIKAVAPNLTAQDHVFNNPWHWQGILPVVDPGDALFKSSDLRFWNRSWVGVPLMLLDCNTTVWEVTYSSVNNQIQYLKAQLANGSLAGIASMPTFPAFGLLDSEMPEVIYDANDQTATPDTMIAGYTFGMSRSFLAHIGGQSSPRPAIRAQTRVPRLIAKVGKAALWALISSNFIYAIVGVALAIGALRVRSKSVMGFRSRLTTGGLAAEIFEKPFSDRHADDEWELFQESDGLKTARIGAEGTERGGTTFSMRYTGVRKGGLGKIDE
ncbi:hypothetical protein EJ04DRAFT_554397 [Polyplosphaeria fusca]|uniref:Uncharacterized protein n=1 Tax=Polyplosphaeria fusca TaxID=682080 RepID=A0A9P4QVZ5_9PLEO|nr:hypothetical protein EJ04DRAFT_554397 [Polyplosphaeria fusca]